MKCPKCDCEAVISANRTIFVQEEGKLYREMTFTCRNRKCPDYEKEVDTIRDELDVTIE